MLLSAETSPKSMQAANADWDVTQQVEASAQANSLLGYVSL